MPRKPGRGAPPVAGQEPLVRRGREPIAGAPGATTAVAAAAWERIGRPYDAALAGAWSSDDAELKNALAGLDELGATAAAPRSGGG